MEQEVKFKCPICGKGWTEMQDDARLEAAHANEKPLKRAITLVKHPRKAHCRPADTRGEADEYPHHQDDVRLKCPMVGTLVIFVQEIYHQGYAYQGNAHPDPVAPVFIPQYECGKLHEQYDSCRIAPCQEKVFTCQFLATHDLAPHARDNVQFVGSSHSVLGLNLKHSVAKIMFIL